eukprot:CFRG2722T1
MGLLRNGLRWFANQKRLLKELGQPMPDPPDYVNVYKRTAAEHKRIILIGLKEYLQTWKSDVEQRRMRKEKLMKDVRVQQEAFEMLSKEAKEGGEGARVLMENMITQRLAIFKLSAKEFTQGYRDGVAGVSYEESTDKDNPNEQGSTEQNSDNDVSNKPKTMCKENLPHS